jgi:hypothetical protein
MTSLTAFIATDPANNPPATDQTVLDWLNASVTVKTQISYTDLIIWSSKETAVARKLRRAQIDQEIAENFNATPWKHTDPAYLGASTDLPGQGTAPPPLALPYTNGVYSDVLSLLWLIQSGADLDLSRDDIRTMVNNLSGSGKPLSSANKDGLLALSDVATPRWETAVPLTLPNNALLTGQPKLEHVAAARAK